MSNHREELNGHTPTHPVRHAEIEAHLAAYTADELAPTTRAAVTHHLAGCAACQAALAETQRIRTLLRALSVVPAPTPQSSLAGAMLARLASSGDTVADPIGAWEEEAERLSDVAHETDPDHAASAWERRDASALPDRHARRPATTRRGALVPALAATAAVVLIGVVLFASFGAGLRPKPPAAHPTPQPTGPILPPYSDIMDMTMLSPGDGWAVGGEALGPATRNVPASSLKALILHYTGGQWQPVSDTFPDVLLRSVSMYSPDDGWAVGRTMHNPLRGVVLHYSGGHWAEVRIPLSLLPPPPPIPNHEMPGFDPSQVQAVGPDDAWMVDDTSGLLLRDRLGAWSVDKSVPWFGGGPTIAMVSDIEGWAITYSGVIYHKHADQWSIDIDLGGNTIITAIRMSSASDGWALASETDTTYDPSGNRTYGPTTLWLLRYHDSSWTKTRLPRQFYGAYGAIVEAFAIQPSGDGWLGGTITDQQPDLGSAFLLHDQGGEVEPVALPVQLDSLGRIAMASPDDGWAMGDRGGTQVLLRYHNGAWTVASQNWGDITETLPVNRSQAVGWQRYTDPTYGFSLEVPASFVTPGPMLFAEYQNQNPFMSLVFLGPYPNDDQIWVMVYTNPDVDVGPGVCQYAGSGAPITVGKGIAAHQVDRTSAAPAPGIPGGVPAVEARFLTGGEYVDIQLLGQGPASTFLTRYGATWQQVLASFTPGPPHPGAHACGS